MNPTKAIAIQLYAGPLDGTETSAFSAAIEVAPQDDEGRHHAYRRTDKRTATGLQIFKWIPPRRAKAA